MAKVNFIIRMAVAMMDSGKTIKWKDLGYYTINQTSKLIKGHGLMINFKVMVNYSIRIQQN